MWDQNLSCFYDDIHMCLCEDFGDQRLANCFRFNHHFQVGDLDFDYNKIEPECSTDYSFDLSASSTVPSRLSASNRSIRSIDSSTLSISACEYFLYLLILLFCLHMHYTE